MAKFFEINGKQAIQLAHMPNGAYNRAKAFASEQNFKIDFAEDGKMTWTAKSNKAIVAGVDAFMSEYAEAHKAYAKAKSKSDKTKSKTEKVACTRKAKPIRTKGDSKKSTLEAFVRANDLCTLEQAKAHGFVGTKNDLWNYKVDLGLRVGKR